jgi:inorganic pyrophosphatase
MEDEKGVDHKIIAVATRDPQYSSYRNLSELPDHKLREIRQFFADYKQLEDKKVNLDEFYGRTRALEILHESMDTFEREYPEASRPDRS